MSVTFSLSLVMSAIKALIPSGSENVTVSSSPTLLFSKIIVRLGLRYAVSWRRLLIASALKYVFSKISPSGKKLTVVPVSFFLHFPTSFKS